MEDLFSIFKNLQRPEQTSGLESFTTAHLLGTSHRVGKDISGYPVLLLNASFDQSGPQIHLENLDVQHSIRCRVTSDGKSEEGQFTIIRCNGADEELAEYFLRSVDPVLRVLGPTPPFSEVMRAIAHLVELFRALAQPPIKSVGGLWAELFLIRYAKNPDALLNAWHSTPEEKYDFNAGMQRIEVKSTSQRTRTHHFSLEQLLPPSGCEVVVASLFVMRSGGGLSLRQLLDELRDLFSGNPELQERLDRVVVLTLGNVLRRSLSERFDRELAAESLQIFRGESVPKVSEQLPPSISDVHFKSDLSQSEVLTKEKLASAGGIFSAI